MADVKELIKGKISGKRVMIFSKSTCPNCKTTKELFPQYFGKELDRKDYEVWEIDREGNDMCAQLQDELRNMTGERTVPRVFVNGKCIGGGSKTLTLHRCGKLAKLLVKTK